MEILEFGDSKDKKLVLVHGFQCPYIVLNNYINYYKKDFHIIVPILPGHDPKRKEEFVSLQESVKEFEDYYITKYGSEIYAVYGMSFGGIFACELWRNQRISIEKLIIESSPLLSFGKKTISLMTWWYLKMSSKVRQRNNGTLKKAVENIVPECYLPQFVELVDNMSDQSIRNYISQVGQFDISGDELIALSAGNKDEAGENRKTTKVVYFYGGKFSEVVFKKVGHFIKHYYKSATIRKLKGKGHCEDSLFHSEQWIFTLNQIL